MDVISILILIFIICAILLGILSYIVSYFFKKIFPPNEEYLLELNNSKFSSINRIIQSAIVLLSLIIKSQIIIILAGVVVIILEIVSLTLKIRHLKSKYDSLDTIKYYLFERLFSFLVIVIILIYVYFKVIR